MSAGLLSTLWNALLSYLPLAPRSLTLTLNLARNLWNTVVLKYLPIVVKSSRLPWTLRNFQKGDDSGSGSDSFEGSCPRNVMAGKKGKKKSEKKNVPTLHSLLPSGVGRFDMRVNLLRQEAMSFLMRNLEEIVTDYYAQGCPEDENVLMIDLRAIKGKDETDPLDLKEAKPSNLYYWRWHKKEHVLKFLLDSRFPEQWAVPESVKYLMKLESTERSNWGKKSNFKAQFFVVVVFGDDPWKEEEKLEKGQKTNPDFCHTSIGMDFMTLFTTRWERKAKLGLAEKCPSWYPALAALEMRMTQLFGDKPPKRKPSEYDLCEQDVGMNDELLAAQLGLHKEWKESIEAAKTAASA